MNTPDGYNSCEQVQSHFALYPLLNAALLWCGSPPNQLNSHLEKAIQVIPGVFSLPYMTCLEPRCRLIHEAIDRGVLPVCREKGYPVDEHVAPARRHLRGKDLREWITKEHPNDKPAFLFDEIERKSHSTISIEAYRVLETDRDAARSAAMKIAKERDNLLMETAALKSCIEKMTPTVKEPESKKDLSETERSSLLKIIIGMAIDAYGYAPIETRNSATGDKNGISARLATKGINIDADTIRKYLNEAKNLL